MIDKTTYYEALSTGKINEVKEMIEKALAAGEKPEDIIKKGLIPAMDQIGVLFRSCEIYIPEVLVAAKAMHAGLNVLKPILAKSTASTAIKVVLGTVKGDLHDIGKNMVGMMLEGGGFEIVDVGVDTPAEKFIQTAQQQGAKVIAMSSLLTTTMDQLKTVIARAKEVGLDSGVKFIVGGAPVTEDFAKKIGADGYAPDAASAVILVRNLLGIA